MSDEATASSGESALLSFTAQNVRCYRDEVHLSLCGTRLAEPGVVHELTTAGRSKPVPVLPAAGVFGANASGKTAILEAIDDMKVVVVNSFRDADSGSRLFRRPFLLDEESTDRPSRMEMDLVVTGVRWQYGFEIDDSRVLGEYAYYYPHGRQALVFNREEGSVEFGQAFRSEKRALMRPLRDNILMISIAGAFGTDHIADVYSWFQHLRYASSYNREERLDRVAELITEPDMRDRILSLLRFADLGISDVSRETPSQEARERLSRMIQAFLGDAEEPDSIRSLDLRGRIQLAHSSSSGSLKISRQDESLGTVVWLGLIGPLLTVLDEGTVLLADELDASLHPLLVRRLIRIFQDKRTNPRCAQLIFNSHDTNILGEAERRVIGRDQVWFTQKESDGVASLYPLSDFSVRRDESIERRYTLGRYGAIPSLNPADVERALILSDK